jgi:hypothetical protein
MLQTIFHCIEIWIALNFAITAFIIYQRSPQFRRQLFDWTIGRFLPTHERESASFAAFRRRR